MYRPRLIVRHSRGGAVSSPTSSLGYGLQGAVAASLTLACAAAGASGEPILLLGCVISGLLLRDVWAWFAARPEERAAFRLRVAQLGGGLDQVRVGDQWGPQGVVVLTGATATCAALIQVHAVFIVATMATAALLVVSLLDLVRKRLVRPAAVSVQSPPGGTGGR